MLSPWTVGRFSDESGADEFFASQIVSDVQALQGTGIDYYPVVFPGYSAYNLQKERAKTSLNSIPRNGGKLYWRQIYNIQSAIVRNGQ